MDGLTMELGLYWAATKDFFFFDTARLAEPDMIVRLGIQALLLCGSAFFSGSETALFSLSRLDLQKLRRERNRHTETLHALLDQPRRLIISILCGNELVNIAAAANMTGILVVLYGVERAGWISVLVMVPLLLLFGEVTPKTISVSNPVRVSTGVVATPMSLWVRVVAPLVWVIRSIADRITTLIVGEEKAAENILQLDEFRTLVEEVAKEGELNATERALIYNLLEAGDTEVVEIMTPRTRTAFLNVEMTVPEMVERFRTFRHPRVPVFRVHRDNLVGFVHAEDILRLVLDDADISTLEVDDIMHLPVVVPLTKKVDEMFDFFTANNARAAAVLNEFGGVEGFVTMKDVLTFIFGQISGDVEGQELYHERDQDSYEVDGDMKLTDFNNLSNFGIEDPRMTTIGGVAFRHLDRLPRVGDSINMEDIVITVLEMDEHRIARVRVIRGVRSEEATSGDVSEGSELAEGADGESRHVVEDRDAEDVSAPADQALTHVHTGVDIPDIHTDPGNDHYGTAGAGESSQDYKRETN
ncbi:MAG: hemolysin family protein [Gammaproteobacteria bacterium]|nr:hemolysin family protein [Gammaproteobacteria bacterium]